MASKENEESNANVFSAGSLTKKEMSCNVSDNNNTCVDLDSEVNENYVIVDIGANLTNKKFTRDLDSVVSRAQDAGQFVIGVSYF